MATKIALIHPSYQRVDMAFSVCKEWILAADHPENVEYLFALDNNDPAVPDYISRLALLEEAKRLARIEINTGDSTDSVKASFRACKTVSSTVELMLQISDDMAPIPHWDTELLQRIAGVDNFKEPKAIIVSDGYWQFGMIYVYPIMNRALYNRLGFLVYPEYTSMFADSDFTEICRRLQCEILAPELLFQHRHFSKGFSAVDATYLRRNNQTEFDSNHVTFQQRTARNFDLDKPAIV